MAATASCVAGDLVYAFNYDLSNADKMQSSFSLAGIGFLA
jgi:hypothetical protein